MLGFTGWLGFWLLVGTLLPFILRRINVRRVEALFFSRNHHYLALVTLLALTVHGLLALTGKRGWGWGARVYLQNQIFSGVSAWFALAAVVLLAWVTAPRSPGLKFHCWVAALLVLLVFIHVF